MRHPHRAFAAVIATVTVIAALSGCSNPDGGMPPGAGSGVGNVGEPAAPAPSIGGAPVDVQRSQREAIAQYARLYVDWTSATLAGDQRLLAAMAVGAARETDRQAAAQTSRDSTLARADLSNSGEVVALAPDAERAGTWVVVTLERTSGSGEYAGLPAAYHVILARLERIGGGWAVREWLPQS